MLVLSLFPGIGLLDMAFEQEGFTVVRGPVVLFEAPLQARTVTSNSGGRGARQRSAYLPMPTVTAVSGGNGVKYGPAPTVTSSDGGGRGPKMQGWRYKLPDACRLQGLPEDFLEDAPFTAEGKLKAVANGVPLPMGRAIARAVKRAMYPDAGEITV